MMTRELPLIEFNFTIDYWGHSSTKHKVQAFNFTSAIIELMCRIETPLEEILTIHHHFVLRKESPK